MRSEETVARNITLRFPASDMKVKSSGVDAVYEISLHDKVLIKIDQVGAYFFFPTNGSGEMKWREIKEGGPEAVAELILRYLADAGYTVLSSKGKRIPKRMVHISRTTLCPECEKRGYIKKIVYGGSSKELDNDRYVFGGQRLGFNDPEIECLNCEWQGHLEDVRFSRTRNKTWFDSKP